jgi:xylulokinase
MTPSECLIGLDVGTSSVKAVAVTLDGRLLGRAATPTPTVRANGGRVEHPADALRRAVLEVLRGLMERTGDRCAACAIGVTSMGEAGALVDRLGNVLHPVIGWSDRRTRPQIDWLRARFSDDELYDLVGHALEPCWGFPKLMWLKEHSAALFETAQCWLSVGDLAVLWLSGERLTDYSLASRTMAFDQTARDWAGALLEAVGIPVGLFPPARQSGTRAGTTDRAVESETGVPAGTPVVVGGHDRLCGAYAARAGSDTVVDSVGTAEAVVVSVAAAEPAAASAKAAHIPRYCDVVPERMAYSARVGQSGAVVEWLRREVFTAPGQPLASYEEMMGELHDPPQFRGVVCYPAFGRSIRASAEDDLMYGAYLGLTDAHTRGDLLQASLEAAGFSLRRNLEALGGTGAGSAGPIRVEGGAAQSAAWMQIRADVIGQDLESIETPHVAALGAALLAGVGAGIYRDHREAAAALRHETRRWQPDIERHHVYDRVYTAVYRDLPASLAPVGRALNTVTASVAERADGAP